MNSWFRLLVNFQLNFSPSVWLNFYFIFSLHLNRFDSPLIYGQCLDTHWIWVRMKGDCDLQSLWMRVPLSFSSSFFSSISFFHSIRFSLNLILCTVTGIVGNEERTWKGESKKESEVTIKPDYLCSTSGYNFLYNPTWWRTPSLSSFLFFFFFCPIHLFIPCFISSVLHSFSPSLVHFTFHNSPEAEDESAWNKSCE